MEIVIDHHEVIIQCTHLHTASHHADIMLSSCSHLQLLSAAARLGLHLMLCGIAGHVLVAFCCSRPNLNFLTSLLLQPLAVDPCLVVSAHLVHNCTVDMMQPKKCPSPSQTSFFFEQNDINKTEDKKELACCVHMSFFSLPLVCLKNCR